MTAITEFGQMDAFVFRVPGTTDKSQARVSTKRQHGDAALGMTVSMPKRRAVGNEDADSEEASLDIGSSSSSGGGAKQAVGADDDEDLPPTVRKRTPRARRETKLTSVRGLIGKVEARGHEGLIELMREHVFVGCASESLALVQHGTKLFLVDLPALTREAFYQASLRRFGDHDRIAVDPPAPVRRLVRAVLESPQAGWTPEDGDKDEIADYVTDLLCKDKAEMLAQYFGLTFSEDNGTLTGVPELIDNYQPPMELLPMFMLRLAVAVDWNSEERCFDSVSRELAEFYMVRPGHTSGALREDLRRHVCTKAAAQPAKADTQADGEEGTGADQGQVDEAWRWCVHHVLFPGECSLLCLQSIPISSAHKSSPNSLCKHSNPMRQPKR